MHRPIKPARPRPYNGGSVACVVVGFLIGVLFLGVIGRYGVPIYVGAFCYLFAVASAFLIWAGFMRPEGA